MERRQRKLAAESAARNAELDGQAVYREAAERGEDPVDLLERESAKRAAEIVAAARAVLLHDKAIARIVREAESREAESGLRAVVDATAVRRQRKEAAEFAAGSVRLDVVEARTNMSGWSGDPLDFLEQETAKREAKIMAVVGECLDDEEIVRVYDEAESTTVGSGWGAIVEAAAESSARKRIDGNAVNVSAQDRGMGQVALLERASSTREIMVAAREAFLDDNVILHIFRDAESNEPGSGAHAVVEATNERRQRKAAAESAARSVGLDPVAAYENAQKLGENRLDFLERTTSTREAEIMEGARAVFLDDNEIERIRGEPEWIETGSGWRAVVEVTEERRQRKDALESAARSIGLDPVTAYENAQKLGENRLDFLERTTSTREAEIMEEARAVFLDDNEIERIRGEPEWIETGSGWRAVVEVTEERRQRKDALESAARSVGLDLAAVFEAARKRDEDRLDFLEEAISTRKAMTVAGARAVFLDDDEIARVSSTRRSPRRRARDGGRLSQSPRSADSRRKLPKPRPEPST